MAGNSGIFCPRSCDFEHHATSDFWQLLSLFARFLATAVRFPAAELTRCRYYSFHRSKRRIPRSGAAATPPPFGRAQELTAVVGLLGNQGQELPGADELSVGGASVGGGALGCGSCFDKRGRQRLFAQGVLRGANEVSASSTSPRAGSNGVAVFHVKGAGSSPSTGWATRTNDTGLNLPRALPTMSTSAKSTWAREVKNAAEKAAMKSRWVPGRRPCLMRPCRPRAYLPLILDKALGGCRTFP